MKYVISKKNENKLVINLKTKVLKEGCQECYDYTNTCPDNDCPDPDCPDIDCPDSDDEGY